MVEKINYNAFVDHDDAKPLNDGIKVDVSKSRFAKIKAPPKRSQEEISKDISNQITNEQEMAAAIASASQQYLALIKSKILPANKELPHKELENNIISKLINLSLELNNDQSQPEGIGSIGSTKLLMHVCLVQRDIINELSYRVRQVEGRVSQLEGSSKKSE